MLSYIGRRVLQLIPLLLVLSVLIFISIVLPPGDYLTIYINQLKTSGTQPGADEIARLTRQYGLDQSLPERYLLWMWNMIRYGSLGRSFEWNKPVTDLIGEQIGLTLLLSLLSLLVTYALAIPIGIYSATHQYKIGDYPFTFLGFVGLSVPPFLLALALVYFSFRYLGLTVTGLFSPQYVDAPWSLAKFVDMMKRIWIPVLIVGLSGTAYTIRVMRACLLDELRKQYVVTARAKGVDERRLLFKYPVRVAINPIVSTVGWLLPALISNTPLVAIVLNIPTTGPMLLRALLDRDMYLAGSFLLVLSVMTVIGTLISDILLAALDPRIRYGGIGE